MKWFIKNFLYKKIFFIILIIYSNSCFADNCAVSNFSTGFLWEQILVPSNIGATVLQKVSTLQATIADILTQTLILDSKLDNLNQTTESILEESATILATSITINSLLDLLQSNTNVIIDNLSVLEVITNILNVDSQINYTKIETLNSTTDVIVQDTNVNLSLVEDIDATLIITNSIFEQIVTCTGLTSINGTTTITNPGNYCVAQPFTGSVTIASSNVALNLNGNRISNPGATAVTINPNLQQISISNGTLGAAATGLQIGSGVTDLELTNLQILDCTNAGINGSGTNFSPISKLRLNNSTIRNASSGIGLQLANAINSQFNLCDFALCSTGVQFNSCFDISMESCNASRNNITGFSLVTSGTNYFKNCIANENGIGSTDSSFGFISTNGSANIFDSCIADGTTTTTINFNSIVAGFALTGSEMCSKIVGCEGCNATGPVINNSGELLITGSVNSSSSPFGIWLQNNMLLTSSSTAASTIISGINSPSGDGIQTAAWSPDNKYLAVANFDYLNPIIAIYTVNYANPAILTSIAQIPTLITMQTVAWSPDGQYLAAITYNSEGSSLSTLALYKFNPNNPNPLTLVQTINTGITDCVAFSWSPNGQYLATASNDVTNAPLQIYAFNGSSTSPLSLTSQINTNTFGPFNGLSWSPNSQFLAMLSNDTPSVLQIYTVNSSTGTLSLFSTVPGFTNGVGNDVQWSPNGNYLAAIQSNANLNSLINLYSVTNVNSPTPILLTTINAQVQNANILRWSPDGKFFALLAPVQPTTNMFLQIYALNPSSNNLISNIATINTTLINSESPLTWSPDGSYIALASSVTNPVIKVYQAFTFPSNNIIQNNVTYCNLIATGTTQYAGVGISGSNIANLIIENTSYNNQANYQFVTKSGIYNPLFNYLPSPLQNISQAGGKAVSYPFNIVPYTNQIQSAVSQLQTQIDTIYANMCVAESQIEQLIPGSGSYQSLLDTAITQMDSAVSIIDFFVPTCASTPITAPTTISTAGTYCLAANISGPIVINADAVSLDLNGYVLTTNGVIVNPNVKVATIKNGTISNVNPAGIQVLSGSSAIKISNVNVEFATQHGILLHNTESVFINNCDLSLCSTGLEIESSNKVVINKTSAVGNSQAGFSLVSSSTNVLLDCKAIANGTNSSTSAYGFVSNSGTGNIFERCIASGTNLPATAISNPGSVAAGFALVGTENCSKIIDSKSYDNTTIQSGNYNTPYGILLQEQFAGINTFATAANNPTPVSLSWSPDNKLLATVDNSGAGTLRIFSFVPLAATLTQVAAFTIATGFTSVAFSPNGQFLATAETTGANASSTIRIFTVNEYNSAVINQIGVTSVSGVGINTIAWSPNNNYLVAGDSSGNVRTFVLNYLQSTGNALTQIGLTNATTYAIAQVAWHPNGKYVTALYTNTVSNEAVIQQFIVNPASSSSAATLSSIQTVNLAVNSSAGSIAWSPCGNYLASATLGTSGAITIFLINASGQLSQLSSTTGASAQISWAPNSNYLAVITSTPSLVVYNFNPLNTSPITSLGSVSIASAATLAWSPDGQYIATNSTNTAAIESVLNFPQQNIIKNNTVGCSTGSGSVAGTSVNLGFGISGSSVANLIVNNLAYNNTNNYAFVTNVFSELLYGNSVPSPLQNIALISKQPEVKPENANLVVDNIQTIASAMQSKVDFLFSAAFP